MRESEVLARVRLALQPLRVTLFRNNVGAYKTPEGNWVRYGLIEGSSDCIGWTEHRVTEADVGRSIAVFTAIETKRSKGGIRSDAQETFVARVLVAGGIAGFAKSTEEAQAIVERFKRPQLALGDV